MTILAHSLDGLLRIRATKNGKAAVVELRSHLFPGDWTWCVFRSQPIDAAWKLFHNQTRFHVDPNAFTQPIVQPGV
jgi:hypothetical protein